MGMQGKCVDLTTHAVTQRPVNQLVLLHHSAVFELLADDRRLEMVAVTLHNDFRIRDAGLDERLDFRTSHSVIASWLIEIIHVSLMQTAITALLPLK
jgi:hypothetical protein